MPWYWSQDFVSIGAAKQQDRIDYDARVKAAFGFLDEADRRVD
jgi:hypothetical protein